MEQILIVVIFELKFVDLWALFTLNDINVESMDQLPHQLPDSVVINIEYLQEYITNISFGVSNIFLLFLLSPYIPVRDTDTVFSGKYYPKHFYLGKILPLHWNQSQICVSSKCNKCIDISNTKENIIEINSTDATLLNRLLHCKKSWRYHHRWGCQNVCPITYYNYIIPMDTVNKKN